MKKINMRPLNDYVLIELIDKAEFTENSTVKVGLVRMIGPLAKGAIESGDIVIYLRFLAHPIDGRDGALWMIKEADIVAITCEDEAEAEMGEGLPNKAGFERSELIRISKRAARMGDIEDINPAWRRAYIALAAAADHLDAIMARAEVEKD